MIQGENVISRLVWKTGKHKSQLDKRKLAMSGRFDCGKTCIGSPIAHHSGFIMSIICHIIGTTGLLPLLIIFQTKDKKLWVSGESGETDGETKN